MGSQYLRTYSLLITTATGSTRTISELKIEFDIVKSVLKAPNTAIITITNSNEDTLSALKEKGTEVSLNVGYGTDLSLIFKGQTTNVVQTASSNETFATIYSRDGIQDWKSSTFDKTFEDTVSPDKILDEVLKSFQNIGVTIKDALPQSLDNLRGTTLSGMSKDVLDKILKKYNFEWSIQNSGFVIKDLSKPISVTDATIINSVTGMINSPIVTEIGANVTTLLNPELLPHTAFKIESVGNDIDLGNLHYRVVPRTRAEGYYRVREVNFKGNSREGDWTSTVIGESINV